MPDIKYILLDAANTLIHKPALWTNVQYVLSKHGYDIPMDSLKFNHKILSECIKFPDQTSRDFYRSFNAELLYSLGIIPNEKLLDDIFDSCTYLPWQPFVDTAALKDLGVPIGILSNFNKNLITIVEGLFGKIFSNVFISENLGVAKPHPQFFELALQEINVPASQVLYIGDSLKLDVEPATKLGLRAMLIDRDNAFPYFKDRITSFKQLENYV